MRSSIISSLKSLLRKMNIEVTRYSEVEKLRHLADLYSNQSLELDFRFFSEMPKNSLEDLLKLYPSSKSQIRQDLFVVSECGVSQEGFFVEFGATNGIDLSNTHLLEKQLNWNGILAEPGKYWHHSLSQNRNCTIEHSCVWSQSGEILEFQDVDEHEYSTIRKFSDQDLHKDRRQQAKCYTVNTISLNDLLVKHNAPQTIDYLSIDTEGSEFEILSHFDFESYDIRVITCEHNYTPIRQNIYDLLSSHGYQRKYESISNFDDWYVKT